VCVHGGVGECALAAVLGATIATISDSHVVFIERSSILHVVVVLVGGCHRWIAPIAHILVQKFEVPIKLSPTLLWVQLGKVDDRRVRIGVDLARDNRDRNFEIAWTSWDDGQLNRLAHIGLVLDLEGEDASRWELLILLMRLLSFQVILHALVDVVLGDDLLLLWAWGAILVVDKSHVPGLLWLLVVCTRIL
jgi:hypothetical protein